MIELILGMSVLEKVFLTCALSGSVVFFIRMLLMFIGFAGGHDVDHHDIPHEISTDVHDIHSELPYDVADHVDTELITHEPAENPVSDSDTSFHFISVQGLTSFMMMFGWVGLAMVRDSQLPELLAVAAGVAAGCVTVWILALIFKFVGGLQSDGTVRIRSALGSGGNVYLRIPANGVGQVQVEVDGRLRIFDAVSSKKEEIKTGEQITVVWVQDNGVLVVDKDKRDEGGKLCGL